MFMEQQADLMFLQQTETVLREKPVDMQENFLEFRFKIVILIILHIS